MLEVFGAVAPLALIVGLSPLPALPMIVLLSGARAIARAASFLVGWSGALFLLLAVSYAVADSTVPPDSDELVSSITWFQLALGALFLALGLLKWRKRRNDPTPPKWLAAVNEYGPGRALRLGSLMAAGNPKNLALTIAAGVELALFPLGGGRLAAGLSTYLILASLAAAAPLVAAVSLGDRSGEVLPRVREGLITHNTTIMAVLMFVIGALMVVKSVPALLPG